MDISTITDKKEISYMLILEQRALASAQRNCQILEARLNQLEEQETSEAVQDVKHADAK